jgi:hypothetical protein
MLAKGVRALGTVRALAPVLLVLTVFRKQS